MVKQRVMPTAHYWGKMLDWTMVFVKDSLKVYLLELLSVLMKEFL